MITFENKKYVSKEDLKSVIFTVNPEEDMEEYDEGLIMHESFYTKKEYKYGNKDIKIADISNNENIFMGYGVFVDNDLKFVIDFYEPHGLSMKNLERGVIVAYGHENVLLVFLDTNTFSIIYTR